MTNNEKSEKQEVESELLENAVEWKLSDEDLDHVTGGRTEYQGDGRLSNEPAVNATVFLKDNIK